MEDERLLWREFLRDLERKCHTLASSLLGLALITIISTTRRAMPPGALDTYEEGTPNLSGFPLAENPVDDSPNIPLPNHDVSVSGQTEPPSATMNTGQTIISDGTVAAVTSKGVEKAPMLSSGHDSDDDSLAAPAHGTQIPDSVVYGIGSVPFSSKGRVPKHTSALTLREHEQTAAAAANTIFELQMQIHFLEEQKSKQADDHISNTPDNNVALKVENAKLSKQNRTLKKELKALQSFMEEQMALIEAERQSYQAEMQDLQEKLALPKASTIQLHQDLINSYGDLRNSHAKLLQEPEDVQHPSHRPSGTTLTHIREVEELNSKLQADSNNIKDALTDKERISMTMEHQLQDERAKSETLIAKISGPEPGLVGATHEQNEARPEVIGTINNREQIGLNQNHVDDQVATSSLHRLNEPVVDTASLRDSVAQSIKAGLAVLRSRQVDTESWILELARSISDCQNCAPDEPFPGTATTLLRLGPLQDSSIIPAVESKQPLELISEGGFEGPKFTELPDQTPISSTYNAWYGEVTSAEAHSQGNPLARPHSRQEQATKPLNTVPIKTVFILGHDFLGKLRRRHVPAYLGEDIYHVHPKEPNVSYQYTLRRSVGLNRAYIFLPVLLAIGLLLWVFVRFRIFPAR